MSDRGAIHAWVLDHRSDLLDTLKRFVGLPSENRMPFGDERMAQEEMARELASIGFEVERFEPDAPQGVRQHPAFMPGREYRDRPCIVGIRRGTGGGRSLLFSGHMDTVPRGLDRWDRSPFTGITEEDRLYGLGAFDMKAGLVAGLLGYRALHDLGWRSKGDLLFESVVDEEFGGANGTLACRVKGVRADLAVVAEPTNGVICPAHRGGAMLRFTFIGRAGHFVGSSISSTSTPNPISAAAKYISLLEDFNAWRNRRPIPPDFADNPELPMELVQMVAGDPSYPMGDRNPGRAHLTVWFECDPDVSQDELLDDLRRFTQPRMMEDPVLSRMQPVIEPQLRFLEGSRMQADHPGIALLAQTAGEVTGEVPRIAGGPFTCDAFLFNRYSTTPALLYGPRGGSAHATDEYVLVQDFLNLVETFALFAVNWAGRDETISGDHKDPLTERSTGQVGSVERAGGAL